MAYRKLKHRILTGSLNLLPPGEKIPEEDALQLTNWRVDQAGQLRSRRGMLSSSGYLGTGVGHTMYRRSPDTRFAAVGGTLQRSVGFHNYENIGSGFDGEPMGFVGYAGQTWIMNRARQVKIKDGSPTFLAWLPVAPTAAPSVTAGAQELKSIATFDSGEAWVVSKPDGSAGASDFAGAAQVGQSLHFQATEAGVWQAKLNGLAKDLGISGQQRADDRFRIWLYGSTPANIEEITVSVDVNGGAFDKDYYFCTMPGPGGAGRSPMSDVQDSWTQIEMRRDLDGSGLAKDNPALLGVLQQLRDATDELRAAALEQSLPTLRAAAIDNTPAFVRVGNTVAKDWSTVAAVRVQVKVLATVDIILDVFDVIGGLDSSIEGDVEYFYTYDTDDGHESNPSPSSGEIHLNKQFGTLTSISVSTDPQVTTRRIYRSGGSLDGAYRVATINDNSSTTFPIAGQRELTDEQAQDLDIKMPPDHDPPPPARGMVGPYFGKFLAYDSDAHPGRFWWTKTAQPWYFPGSDDDAEGNWEDVGEETERIYYITTRKKLVIFYKRRSIWRLEGDPDLNDPEKTNANVAAIGPQAVCSAGSIDYFAAADGIYEFNGDSERKISQKIDPIFHGDYTILSQNADGSPNVTISPMNQDQKAKACLAFDVNGQLWFSYPTSNGPLPTNTLIYNPSTGVWSQHLLDPDLNGARAFSAFYNEGQDQAMLGFVSVSASWPSNGTGGAAAAVYEISQFGLNDTDDGNLIPLIWHSRYNDMGLPDNVKICEDLVIEYQTGNYLGSSGLVASVYLDNGKTAVAVGVLNSKIRDTAIFKLNGGLGQRCRNIAVRIEGSTGFECLIYSVYVHYYVEARQALSFDTGVTDLGTHLAKQISEMDFDIEAEGIVTWRWYADIPGQLLVLRQTNTFPAPASRKRVEVQMLTDPANLVEGRKLRLVVSSDRKFRLHGLRVRMRRIGELADGTTGEIWDSNEYGYGI